MRTFLTVLGLTMGVATLIGVVTIIQGANDFVADKVANLGTGVFRVAKQSFDITDLEEYYRSQSNPDLTLADLDAVRAGCPACGAVGATVTTRVRADHRGVEVQDVALEGQTASMADISNRELASGRYFNELEDRHAARVCLLGSEVAARLYPSVEPIGRSIRVDNEELEVIGVFSAVGSVLGQNQDLFVVVPLDTYRRMRGLRSSLTIEIEAGEGARFDEAQGQVRTVLRARRNIGPRQKENFYIGTSDSYIALWNTISASFVIVFAGVSSIAALVGGIVIMNIMLVSVTQRTPEIGVRRAVGARRSDILRQFLTESVLQCLAGGVIGVGFGFLAALLLREAADFPARLEWWTAALGVGFAGCVGLFFGIYPAMRAAELDPVEALRTER
ncbi:MAG: ABC transporter permease [Acidobacteria bacterium]|nr:ABC transporter permease [Acidobacteriota bacterium]